MLGGFIPHHAAIVGTGIEPPSTSSPQIISILGFSWSCAWTKLGTNKLSSRVSPKRRNRFDRVRLSFNKVSNPEVILESPFTLLAGVSGFCRLVTLDFFVTVTGLPSIDANFRDRGIETHARFLLQIIALRTNTISGYLLSVSAYCDFNPGRIEIGYPGKRIDCGIIHQLIDVDAETKRFFLIRPKRTPVSPQPCWMQTTPGATRSLMRDLIERLPTADVTSILAPSFIPRECASKLAGVFPIRVVEPNHNPLLRSHNMNSSPVSVGMERRTCPDSTPKKPRSHSRWRRMKLLRETHVTMTCSNIRSRASSLTSLAHLAL